MFLLLHKYTDAGNRHGSSMNHVAFVGFKCIFIYNFLILPYSKLQSELGLLPDYSNHAHTISEFEISL